MGDLELWQQLTGGGLVTTAIGRLLWRRLHKPSAPSLPVRLWSWFLITGDREVDNQQLRRQLLARDEVIHMLQLDLERAVGIASLHTSRETGHHHPQSNPQTKRSPSNLPDTTS